jgi:hypothetical protein
MVDRSRLKSTPQGINELLSDSESGFGRIIKRARALERLNRRISGLLDDDLARHCQLANVRDHRMIFACDSPACATRLRMLAPDLLDQLHEAGMHEIEAIEVKMTPPK